jgi:hypothetical protein
MAKSFELRASSFNDSPAALNKQQVVQPRRAERAEVVVKARHRSGSGSWVGSGERIFVQREDGQGKKTRGNRLGARLGQAEVTRRFFFRWGLK